MLDYKLKTKSARKGKHSWINDSNATDVPIFKINSLLLIQKRISLLLNSNRLPTVYISILDRLIKKSDVSMKNYFKAYGKLDNDFNDRIFASLIHQSNKELNDDRSYPKIWKIWDKIEIDSKKK